MAGFSLNLKKTGKDGSKQNGLTSTRVTLGSNKKFAPKNTGLLHESDESDDEGKITNIDSFDGKKGGAMAGKVVIGVKKSSPMVIIPLDLRKGMKRPIPNQHSKEDLEDKIREEKKAKLEYGVTHFEKVKSQKQEIVETQNQDDKIRQSLLSNDNPERGDKLVIRVEDNFKQTIDDAPDEDSDEEYTKVPVDQFGAAMLRGMGWKPTSTQSNTGKSSILDHRKKGQLLGIGAKALDSDLIDDIMGKKGIK